VVWTKRTNQVDGFTSITGETPSWDVTQDQSHVPVATTFDWFVTGWFSSPGWFVGVDSYWPAIAPIVSIWAKINGIEITWTNLVSVVTTWATQSPQLASWIERTATDDGFVKLGTSIGLTWTDKAAISTLWSKRAASPGGWT